VQEDFFFASTNNASHLVPANVFLVSVVQPDFLNLELILKRKDDFGGINRKYRHQE
jgi:hypothetical protein